MGILNENSDFPLKLKGFLLVVCCEFINKFGVIRKVYSDFERCYLD